MLAISVELDDCVVAVLQGELEGGAHGGPYAQVDRVGHDACACGSRDARRGITRTVVDEHDIAQRMNRGERRQYLTDDRRLVERRDRDKYSHSRLAYRERLNREVTRASAREGPSARR